MQDSYASGRSLHVRVTQTLRLNNKITANSISEIRCKSTAFFSVMPYTFGKPPPLEKSRPIEI